jgi:MYXO-CTERM domain-containing protein
MKTVITTLALTALSSSAAFAAYVTPGFAGGTQSGPMVMPNVVFDGQNLTIDALLDDEMNPISQFPVLRPLTAPDAFDPARPFSVLTGKAFNFQYGWNLDGNSEFLPPGTSIWIEETASTPGLEAYTAMTYQPIFGTAGTSEKWRWNGVMAHNAYAVPSSVGDWSASYRLYVGDASGNAVAGYGDAAITLNWTSVPEPAALGLLGLAGVALLRRQQNRV